MKRSRVVTAILIGAVFAVGFVFLGIAGAQREAPVQQYEGKIKSLRVDKCGERPGTCEGSIVLAQKIGGEVPLSIKPGTWIRRGDKFVVIEDLKVGDTIQARAVVFGGDLTPQITDIWTSGGE